ncbi:MAG: HNH endonuclease signature motif containing protein [Psychrobacter pacificensis]|uniref:HNH endonuclease n=1 Tax=Psychrobacter pacificensis TaxID=112002 RepID=UPI002393ADB4|nr:HNH endonuclease signature motif containing protein [Psychrobacter pacificensis]MDE0844280.1 HNH endonuclease signature motif containing protein [Psychrobacter pacificensis]
MPMMPTKLCSHAGCNASAGANGVCRLHKPKPKHQKATQIKQAEPAKLKRIDNRPSSAQRGYDARWRSARELYLADEPLCRNCMLQNIITGADVVDHIIPHRGDYELFWDQTNWQPLCYSCHSIKTTTIDNKLSDYDVAQLKAGRVG